ncbi:MAG: hypothetical protein JWM86_1792 [Thermoleophilia bacterium]|nr:hypothetical protein [Thermoleophilia bacterium]
MIGAARRMAQTSPRIRLLIALTLTVCALALVPTAASAAIIHVDAASVAPDVSCGAPTAPCATLAAAALHGTGGDEIRIAPGDYQGTNFAETTHLLGPATGEARIHSRISSTASLEVARLTFTGVASGPAIYVSGDAEDAVLVRDSRFDAVGGGTAIELDALAAATISGTTFTNNAGAAVLARGARGLQLVDNLVRGGGSLLDIADSDGAADPILVARNVATNLSGHAISIGAGVRGVTVRQNRFLAIGGAAIEVHDLVGEGATSDLAIRGNDVEDARYAVRARSIVLEGAVTIRSNRFVALRTAALVNQSPLGATLDARGNWWGRSAGAAPATLIGAGIDASTPLRLVGVDAPAAIRVGSSGEVGIRLVGPVGGEPDADIAGFPVTFTSSLAEVEPRTVVVAGRARTLITAGSNPGESETVATLDDEVVRATTLILPSGAVLPGGTAEPTVAATPIPRFTATIQLVRRWAGRALGRGIAHVVTSNRPSSVRTVASVDHVTARLLGLRPATSTTRNPYQVGRVVTRAATGRRVVTVRLDADVRTLIRDYGHPVAIHLVTRVGTASGARRLAYRRIVLPAGVR